MSFYGGRVWEGFGPAGFLYLRFTNLHTAATHSLGNERGSSQFDMGATSMHALNPLKIRPCVHVYRALSALHSTAARLHDHAPMAIVRRLSAHPAPQGTRVSQ